MNKVNLELCGWEIDHDTIPGSTPNTNPWLIKSLLWIHAKFEHVEQDLHVTLRLHEATHNSIAAEQVAFKYAKRYEVRKRRLSALILLNLSQNVLQTPTVSSIGIDNISMITLWVICYHNTLNYLIAWIIWYLLIGDTLNHSISSQWKHFTFLSSIDSIVFLGIILKLDRRTY